MCFYVPLLTIPLKRVVSNAPPRSSIIYLARPPVRGLVRLLSYHDFLHTAPLTPSEFAAHILERCQTWISSTEITLLHISSNRLSYPRCTIKTLELTRVSNNLHTLTFLHPPRFESEAHSTFTVCCGPIHFRFKFQRDRPIVRTLEV